MWKYVKTLEYPVNIKKKDLRMAKYLVTQYGGANGELAAAWRYLNQRYTMPDDKGKALLTDIGTEELAHVEIISTMIYQLMKDASLEEIKEAGLDTHYAEHGKGLYPTDANGVPFTVMYFATTGDPVADLSEDMAAEQKAREALLGCAPSQKLFKLIDVHKKEDVEFPRDYTDYEASVNVSKLPAGVEIGFKYDAFGPVKEHIAADDEWFKEL